MQTSAAKLVKNTSPKKLSRILASVETRVGTIVELDDGEIYVVKTLADLDRLVDTLQK